MINQESKRLQHKALDLVQLIEQSGIGYLEVVEGDNLEDHDWSELGSQFIRHAHTWVDLCLWTDTKEDYSLAGVQIFHLEEGFDFYNIHNKGNDAGYTQVGHFAVAQDQLAQIMSLVNTWNLNTMIQATV